MALLTRVAGRGISKAARKTGREVAEAASKRQAKFMGMVEEVEPLRLGSNKPKTSAGKTAAATAAVAAGVGAAKAMSGDDKKSTASKTAAATSPKTSSKTAATASQSPSKPAVASSTSAPAKKTSSGGVSNFGKSFREARNAGLKEFTWNGKRYNTMLKGESKEQHAAKIKQIKEKNSAALDKKMMDFQRKK